MGTITFPRTRLIEPDKPGVVGAGRRHPAASSGAAAYQVNKVPVASEQPLPAHPSNVNDAHQHTCPAPRRADRVSCREAHGITAVFHRIIESPRHLAGHESSQKTSNETNLGTATPVCAFGDVAEKR